MEIFKVNGSVVLVLIAFLFTTMYVYEIIITKDSGLIRELFGKTKLNTEFQEEGYIIYNSKCRLPDLDPFNSDAIPFFARKSYVSCRTKDLLTYVENNGTVAILYINETVEPLYTIGRTKCRLSYVSRINDMNIKFSDYVEFESGIVLKGNTVVVRCYSRWTQEEVYVNTHSVAVLDENLRKHAQKDKDKPNILLVGIDSVSRLNFHRSMPKTAKYMQENGFNEYLGYNKIDDNTFPNLMAILTGSNFSRTVEYCDPYKGNLSNCDFIWKDFKNSGYLTAYAEDETELNTFNYMKDGFQKQPTDFFYLPYMLASEVLGTNTLDSRSYCAGPETSVERILNAAWDFSTALDGYPKFGLFWSSTASHDYLNSISRMDEVYVNFFRNMKENGLLNNTVLVFFSDHGLRFGNILLTRSGWLEERLPFLYISVPPSLQGLYPKKYENLKTNTKRLVTPYDLHLTLKEVLMLDDPFYRPNGSDACPKCRSLFKEIEEVRSCEDAAISMHWCTCIGYRAYDPNDSLSQNAVEFILGGLNKKTLQNKLVTSICSLLKKNKIISASISLNDDQWYKNETYLAVVFKTIPETILQATVKVKKIADGETSFRLQGGISRLDYYKRTAQCMDIWAYKTYCYCKWNQLLDMNYFTFWFEV